MEVVLEGKRVGKVRFVGFTGHKSPDIHLKMLATAAQHGFTFDAVQMPLNLMDAHCNSFERKVLPVLTKDGVGVLGMKPMGDPFILRSQTVTAVECPDYAMNLHTQCRHHGLRFASDPSASPAGRPYLSADGFFRGSSSSREDAKGGGSRPVRTLQNNSPL